MVVGRGSFIDAFPLFGLQLEDYDSLFAENLDLLLKIRENEHVHWSGTASGAADRPGRLPEARAESVADMAGCWRDAAVVRSRRRARTSADGRDHRRRDATLPSAHRSLSGGRRARRALARSTEGRRARARAMSRRRSSRPPTSSIPATLAPSRMSRRSADGLPLTRARFDAQLGPTARC